MYGVNARPVIGHHHPNRGAACGAIPLMFDQCDANFLASAAIFDGILYEICEDLLKLIRISRNQNRPLGDIQAQGDARFVRQRAQ